MMNDETDNYDGMDSVNEAESQADAVNAEEATASAEATPFVFVRKDYANPIAQGEQAIAMLIETLPRVAKEGITVVGNTEEGANEVIKRQVERQVNVCIVVSLSNLTEINHTQRKVADGTVYRAVATAELAVSIVCPAVMSTAKASSTTDVGYAIVQALDGVLFSAPFLTPLEFTGWEQAEYTNGIFSTILTFTCQIGLLELTTNIGKD